MTLEFVQSKLVKRQQRGSTSKGLAVDDAAAHTHTEGEICLLHVNKTGKLLWILNSFGKAAGPSGEAFCLVVQEIKSTL